MKIVNRDVLKDLLNRYSQEDADIINCQIITWEALMVNYKDHYQQDKAIRGLLDTILALILNGEFLKGGSKIEK